MAKNPAQLDFGLLVLDPDQHRIESTKKPRKCLSCEKQFKSHGPGNRICSSCKSLSAWTSNTSECAECAIAF
jgi:hypothetical protein